MEPTQGDSRIHTHYPETFPMDHCGEEGEKDPERTSQGPHSTGQGWRSTGVSPSLSEPVPPYGKESVRIPPQGLTVRIKCDQALNVVLSSVPRVKYV